MGLGLKDLRRDAGLSVAQAVAELGKRGHSITERTLRNWEMAPPELVRRELVDIYYRAWMRTRWKGAPDSGHTPYEDEQGE
jgi:hypothetical protein